MTYSIIWYPKDTPTKTESIYNIESFYSAINLLIDKITFMAPSYIVDNSVNYDEWDEIIDLISQTRFTNVESKKYYLPNRYVIELIKND